MAKKQVEVEVTATEDAYNAGFLDGAQMGEGARGELVGLVRQVLAYTHATPRLPPALLARMKAAISQ